MSSAAIISTSAPATCQHGLKGTKTRDTKHKSKQIHCYSPWCNAVHTSVAALEKMNRSHARLALLATDFLEQFYSPIRDYNNQGRFDGEDGRRRYPPDDVRLPSKANLKGTKRTCSSPTTLSEGLCRRLSRNGPLSSSNTNHNQSRQIINSYPPYQKGWSATCSTGDKYDHYSRARLELLLSNLLPRPFPSMQDLLNTKQTMKTSSSRSVRKQNVIPNQNMKSTRKESITKPSNSNAIMIRNNSAIKQFNNNMKRNDSFTKQSNNNKIRNDIGRKQYSNNMIRRDITNTNLHRQHGQKDKVVPSANIERRNRVQSDTKFENKSRKDSMTSSLSGGKRRSELDFVDINRRKYSSTRLKGRKIIQHTISKSYITPRKDTQTNALTSLGYGYETKAANYDRQWNASRNQSSTKVRKDTRATTDGPVCRFCGNSHHHVRGDNCGSDQAKADDVDNDDDDDDDADADVVVAVDDEDGGDDAPYTDSGDVNKGFINTTSASGNLHQQHLPSRSDEVRVQPSSIYKNYEQNHENYNTIATKKSSKRSKYQSSSNLVYPINTQNTKLRRRKSTGMVTSQEDRKEKLEEEKCCSNIFSNFFEERFEQINNRRKEREENFRRQRMADIQKKLTTFDMKYGELVTKLLIQDTENDDQNRSENLSRSDIEKQKRLKSDETNIVSTADGGRDRCDESDNHFEDPNNVYSERKSTKNIENCQSAENLSNSDDTAACNDAKPRSNLKKNEINARNTVDQFIAEYSGGRITSKMDLGRESPPSSREYFNSIRRYSKNRMDVVPRQGVHQWRRSRNSLYIDPFCY